MTMNFFEWYVYNFFVGASKHLNFNALAEKSWKSNTVRHENVITLVAHHRQGQYSNNQMSVDIVQSRKLTFVWTGDMQKAKLMDVR